MGYSRRISPLPAVSLTPLFQNSTPIHLSLGEFCASSHQFIGKTFCMTGFQGPTNINLLFKSNSLTSTANLLEVIPDRATITLSAGCYFHVRSLLAVDELFVAEST